MGGGEVCVLQTCPVHTPLFEIRLKWIGTFPRIHEQYLDIDF